jgi:hypothetical protein
MNLLKADAKTEAKNQDEESKSRKNREYMMEMLNNIFMQFL